MQIKTQTQIKNKYLNLSDNFDEKENEKNLENGSSSQFESRRFRGSEKSVNSVFSVFDRGR